MPNKYLKTRMVKKEKEDGSHLLFALKNGFDEEKIISLIHKTKNLNVRDRMA